MNLTEKEISNFNKARTEDDFYKQYSKVIKCPLHFTEFIICVFFGYFVTMELSNKLHIVTQKVL